MEEPDNITEHKSTPLLENTNSSDDNESTEVLATSSLSSSGFKRSKRMFDLVGLDDPKSRRLKLPLNGKEIESPLEPVNNAKKFKSSMSPFDNSFASFKELQILLQKEYSKS